MGVINHYFLITFQITYELQFLKITIDMVLKILLNELFLAFVNAYIIRYTSRMQHEKKEN